jgi:puromycin-sensitive aminopeptidase
VPRHTKPAARRGPANGFRLSTDVQPIEYRVDLSVEPARGTFGGEVLIRLDLARPRQAIELHAADIQVRTATLASPEGAGPTARGRIVRHPERETVEIRLPRRVGAGQWTLRLRFAGRLQEGLRGLYGVRVDGDAYAFTQLEAADARRFFPCFDEPAFKARFTFRVTTDATYTVLSNSAPATIQQQEGNRTTVEFGPTPKLSTYLCALAVGALESSAPRHLGSTPIRVWHVPGKGHLTDLALDAAVATLTRLEQYFDLPYPYDKLDLVAVPDFEAGAMENAGAVFFRETLLLADPATITLAEHKRLAEVIAHELAHMWYGNLVTMTWWNDLWLNEAFATWMAFRIVDDWKPGWRMWNNFEHHRAAALSLDALVHTHPIYADVRNVSEATENFDAITYEKGAAVVRMIERYLGAEPFRDGVRLYIRRHRDGNATARDLWQALSETSGKQVEHIVRTWIETPGFPLLTVRDDNDEATVGFAVSHERFFANPHTAAGGRRQQWPIPWVVKYQTTNMAQPATARHLIQTRRDHLFLDAANPLRWYYANADQAGFYRVRHDDGNLKSLALALQTALTPVERMGLLSDQWALVRNGGAPIETFLRLASGCHNETDHDVLEELAGALSFIEDHLLDAAGPGARQAFHAWIARLFMPQLIHCGWDAKPAESDDTRLRRAAVVRVLAEVAHAPTVSSTAAARAMRYLDDRTSLDPNLVDTAVFVGGRDGDADRFERYRAALRDARTPQERRRFQLALAAFRLPELIDRTLGLTLTDDVPTQDVALVLIRAFANPAARERTWRFITRRWTQLRRRLPPMMIARVIEATPALQTPAMMREVAAFFGAHPVPTATRALRQALERFELNNELRRRTAPGLARWLAET